MMNRDRLIGIGDIHGCALTLEHLLFNKVVIQRTDTVIFIGDYIDRGARSKDVIDLILDLKKKNFDIVCLRGNHEEQFINSAMDSNQKDHWIRNGGNATLKSFAVSGFENLSSEYKTFFQASSFYFELDGVLFSHACPNFDIENPLADTYSMVWNRKTPSDTTWLNGRRLVHGHTPISLEKILAQQENIIINIDGGCVFKNNKGLGNLIALDLTNLKFYSQENVD